MSSRYVSSHPGQLSLLPSVGWEMSTGWSAVMLQGWEVKAGMAHSTCELNMVASEIVWSIVNGWFLSALRLSIIYKALLFFHHIFVFCPDLFHSVLWHCLLGVWKSIWLVKIEWWGFGAVSCLKQGASDLHVVQFWSLWPNQLQKSICCSLVCNCLQLSSDDAATVPWRTEPQVKHARSKTVSEGVKLDAEHWSEGIFHCYQFHFHFG